MELIAGCVVGAALLLLLLFAVSNPGRKASLITRQVGRALRPGVRADFHSDLVRRIFSKEDWEFIAKMESAPLLRGFRKERKAVALKWVRQTSGTISLAIQEHTRAASRSENLKVGTELQVFARYLGLRLICGLMIVSIHFVNLHVIESLALQTRKFTKDFLGAQPHLAANNAVTSSTSSPTI
jgi:hypothetical protein